MRFAYGEYIVTINNGAPGHYTIKYERGDHLVLESEGGTLSEVIIHALQSIDLSNELKLEIPELARQRRFVATVVSKVAVVQRRAHYAAEAQKIIRANR